MKRHARCIIAIRSDFLSDSFPLTSDGNHLSEFDSRQLRFMDMKFLAPNLMLKHRSETRCSRQLYLSRGCSCWSKTAHLTYTNDNLSNYLWAVERRSVLCILPQSNYEVVVMPSTSRPICVCKMYLGRITHAIYSTDIEMLG